MYPNPTKRKRRQQEINYNKQKMNKTSGMIDAHQFDIGEKVMGTTSLSIGLTISFPIMGNNNITSARGNLGVDHLDTNNNNNNEAIDDCSSSSPLSSEFFNNRTTKQHHQRRPSRTEEKKTMRIWASASRQRREQQRQIRTKTTRNKQTTRTILQPRYPTCRRRLKRTSSTRWRSSFGYDRL